MDQGQRLGAQVKHPAQTLIVVLAQLHALDLGLNSRQPLPFQVVDGAGISSLEGVERLAHEHFGSGLAGSRFAILAVNLTGQCRSKILLCPVSDLCGFDHAQLGGGQNLAQCVEAAPPIFAAIAPWGFRPDLDHTRPSVVVHQATVNLAIFGQDHPANRHGGNGFKRKRVFQR